jgi:hypothetical protein
MRFVKAMVAAWLVALGAFWLVLAIAGAAVGHEEQHTVSGRGHISGLGALLLFAPFALVFALVLGSLTWYLLRTQHWDRLWQFSLAGGIAGYVGMGMISLSRLVQFDPITAAFVLGGAASGLAFRLVYGPVLLAQPVGPTRSDLAV